MEPMWTEADYLALRAAIASGVKSVQYDGPPKRVVEYQDLKQMRELLADMWQCLNPSASGSRSSLVSTSKGVR